VSRTGTILFALATSVILGACTAVKLSYNHADDILRFMASGYFDFDERQLDQFKVRVSHLHDWHRANELPRYVDLLHSAGGRVSQGLKPGDVEWATGAVRSRYRLLAGRAAEEAAPLLATLHPEQLESMEKKIEKNNAKYAREWLSADPRKRERRLLDRTMDRFEEWTGDLNAEQRRRVEEFVRSHPRVIEIRFAERRRWQAEALQLIKRHKDPAELAPRLAKLFTDPETGRSQEYLRENRRWEAGLAQLVLDLDRTLSPGQRERVMRRMNRYADDFQALAGSSKSVAGEPRPGMAGS
jgi:hypothetical protein